MLEARWTAGRRRLTAAAAGVVGNHYRENYDVHHLDPELPLAVIADGMGDGPGSAFAGRTAVDRFARSQREATQAQAPAALRATVAKIQEEVRLSGRDLPGLVGCTLTALVADEAEGAWIVQLGDSRAYRLRDGLLELLTVDHTAAWLGLLHAWFAADSPDARAARYELTRYIGHPDAPEPDVLNVSLRPADVYLLCTDGVADQLTYDQIRDALSGEPPVGPLRDAASRPGGRSVRDGTPRAAVRVLLDATLAAGGADNATAVVIRVLPD